MELRSEWSLLHHTPTVGTGSFDSHGWYVLASYRLPGSLQALRPYTLVEALKVAQGEAYFAGVPDERAVAIGLRYDVNRWVALKGDCRVQKVGDSGRRGVARFQLAANF